MKVLIYTVMHVNPPDYGGAIRLNSVIQNLINNKINVVLISPKRPNADDQNYASNYFKSIYINTYTNVLINKYNLRKIKYFFWFFLYFEELLLLNKIIKEEKKNESLVLHSEVLFSTPPLLILKFLYKLPLILTEQNVESDINYEINHNKVLYIFLNMVEHFYAKMSNHIVCVSQIDKQRIIKKFHVTSDKVTVIPNSVITDEVKESDKKDIIGMYNIPDNYIIIFMGTFKYVPNLNGLQIIKNEIYPRLKSKIGNIKILIVGKGIDPHIEGDIIFTGRVDHVGPYIKTSDVAICPLTEGGGTRLKILEYMAYSKPVVSTSKGCEGIECTANDNIVISDNWDEFTDEIIRLLMDKEYAKFIGNNAMNLINEKYNWSNNILLYINVYNKYI